jgi:hypothetical protein
MGLTVVLELVNELLPGGLEMGEQPTTFIVILPTIQELPQKF